MAGIDKKKYAAQSLMDERLHHNIRNYEKYMREMNRGITPIGENFFKLYSVAANIYNLYFRIMVSNLDQLKKLDNHWNKIELRVDDYIEEKYNYETQELEDKKQLRTIIRKIDNFIKHLFWELQRQNYFYYTISSSGMDDLVNLIEGDTNENK